MYFPKPHNILIYLSYSGKSLWYVSSIDHGYRLRNVLIIQNIPLVIEESVDL